MVNRDDFLTQIGRARDIDRPNKTSTFVRVVHTPSGKERVVGTIGKESVLEVDERFVREIELELEREASNQAGEAGS
ncbi:MAG TPA: hypothetical protein VJ783_22950 [Pirellulales bacterium]|nr:hypothetical protein [Pirellulales bacterium]